MSHTLSNELAEMSENTIIPLVSVVMSVYNGEKYLRQAVESILNQTFRDFELIIINDGSTDATREIIEHYQQADARIHLYHQENCGLPVSLKRGCHLAQGKYIARMDADDVSLPQRVAKQVNFLETYSEVALCGTWIKTIGKPVNAVCKRPTDNAAIQGWLLFDNAFVHSSVMFCRERFVHNQLYYNVSYKYAQDYELWERASRGLTLSNIPEVLVLYRWHSQQMGQTYSEEVILKENKCIHLAQLERLGIKPTEEELKLHGSLRTLKFPVTKAYVQKIHDWLRNLKAANDKTKTYDELEFAKTLAQRWFAICAASTGLGYWAWQVLWDSPLIDSTVLNWKHFLKFWIKFGINLIKIRNL